MNVIMATTITNEYFNRSQCQIGTSHDCVTSVNVNTSTMITLTLRTNVIIVTIVIPTTELIRIISSSDIMRGNEYSDDYD